MVGEDMDIADLQYIVILHDKHGLSAALTTEGKVFIIAIPFKMETSAREYCRAIKSLINKHGILFRRVQPEA
jgi:hypothetical protein